MRGVKKESGSQTGPMMLMMLALARLLGPQSALIINHQENAQSTCCGQCLWL